MSKHIAHCKLVEKKVQFITTAETRREESKKIHRLKKNRKRCCFEYMMQSVTFWKREFWDMQMNCRRSEGEKRGKESTTHHLYS